MNIVVHSSYEILNKNENLILGNIDPTIENFGQFFSELKTELQTIGWKLKSSWNYIPNPESDIILFIDIPKNSDKFYNFYQKKDNIKKYLWVWESPIINQKGHDVTTLDKFDKVFTYNKNMPNSIELNYCTNLRNFKTVPFIEKTILVNLIASNRYDNHPNELYSYRRKLIDDLTVANLDFKLYGKQWHDAIPPKNLIEKILNKLGLSKYVYNAPNSFCGSLESKSDVLSSSLFTICIENCKNDRYYVSEKIFDALQNCSVPLYLGCEQIDDILPKGTYVDLRRFENNIELISYIRSFAKEDYEAFKSNLEHVVASEQLKKFDSNFVVKYFAQELTK